MSPLVFFKGDIFCCLIRLQSGASFVFWREVTENTHIKRFYPVKFICAATSVYLFPICLSDQARTA